MEGIVDYRLRARGCVIFLDHSAQRLAAMLRRKRDHRGGPSKRRRYRCAVEIVGADDAGRGALLDMTVAVDAARQDQPAGRVDLVHTRAEAFAERCNDAVLDADIAKRRVGCGYHLAVADHQVELAHVMFLLRDLQRPSTSGRSSATVRGENIAQKGSP